MFYTQEQIAAGAAALQIEAEMMMAVAIKETSGKKLTFRYKGRDIPQILYERHQFWRELVKAGTDPRSILNTSPAAKEVLAQTPYSRYGRFITQYSRRDQAIQINREAAFASCSYSGFQIMGYWFNECGYSSAEEFAEAMADPDKHIPAFVRLVQHKGLQKALQERDFATFAEGWNGPKYYVKGYHIELSRIYQRQLAKTLPRQDTALAAVVQSQTIKRGAATVITAAVPAVSALSESDSLTKIIDAAKELASRGEQINNQIDQLQAQATAIAPLLDWLPWAAGTWTALLLLIFAALVRRYLHDRGYV